MAWTHTHDWQLAAPPEEVFAAFTEASRLKAWFADEVALSAKSGGDFRFWGKRTLGAPTAGEATQRFRSVTEGEGLAFSWTILGVPTTVSVMFGKHGKGTKMQISHTVEGEFAVPRQREMIDDHWRLQCGNLAAHLAGGDGMYVPDFSLAEPEIRLATVVEAPPARVFRTMLDPACVNSWFGSKKVRVDPVEGGEYWIGWEYKVDGRDVVGGTTRILELVPDTRLVLDWLDWRGDATVKGQTIAFTLRPQGAHTTVEFVHGGFSRTADLSDYPWGWVHFLGQLRKVVLAAHE